MPRNDKPISRATEKAIFHEAAAACPFCGDTTFAVLQIHHIDPRAEGGSNHRSNLILCCASCHDKIEAGVISLSEVLRAKDALSAGRNRRHRQPAALPVPHNVVNFRGPNIVATGPNPGVVATRVDKVTITTPRRPRVQPPADVLVAEADQRTYVKYLIDRYHAFKKAEVGPRMKYSIIHAAIKREFGCTWEFVPLARFVDLVALLQHRIDGTILGRNKCARGQLSYSPFDKYLSDKRYGDPHSGG